MHIPNGFLTDPVCTATTLASAGAIGYGFARIREAEGSRGAAWMAATGAGIFAAQMVNFPVSGGTSGHVIGAALAAIVLGPWRGMLTMAVVLAVQCLAFGDGGFGVLGANLLNMAVVSTLVASGIYTLTTGRVAGTTGKLLGAALASAGSVMAAATLCAIELAASGTYAFAEVLSAMLSIHLLIALCEAVITTTVLAAGLAIAAENKTFSPRSVAIGGLALAVAVAGLLAPLASSSPDGLERVAVDLQFAGLANQTYAAVAPDYELPGIAWPMAAVALAGIGGVLLVFASNYLVARTAKVRVRKR
ncbi:MAG: cobalt transporter [Planctomycetota bacterium]|nr:MAG: cobalt transporter [Planctomycetota bacterium]